MQYNVQNGLSAPIAPGTPLNFYEFNQNTQVFKCRVADAMTVPPRPAHAVTLDGLNAGGVDVAYDTATTIANLNTTAIGAALNASVYLGPNGTYLSAAPSGGLSQVVGTVAVLSALVGSIAVALAPDLRSLMPVPAANAIAVDETGSAIAIDVLVATNGIDDASGSTLQSVVQADANNHIVAQWVTAQAAVDEGNVQLVRTGLSQANLNTNAGNVGDPVYLSETAGGWTLSAPTASNSFVQEVGRIVVKSATVGQILWDIKTPILWGSNEMRASAAVTLDGVTLDALGAGSTAEVAAAGVGTTQLANLGVTTGKIAANAVTAAKLALYAESGLTVGPQVQLELDIADGATGNVDFVNAVKFVCTDARLIVNGTNTAVANTVQVDNGTGGNHITEAMSTNGKVLGDIVRAAFISPTFFTIAAGATIRVVRTRAGGANASKVVLEGYLVA